MYLQKPLEITLLYTEKKEILNSLVKRFLPESILVTINNQNQINNLSKYSFFEGKQFNIEKTTVFICKDFTCSLPLESILDIEAQF